MVRAAGEIPPASGWVMGILVLRVVAPPVSRRAEWECEGMVRPLGRSLLLEEGGSVA